MTAGCSMQPTFRMASPRPARHGCDEHNRADLTGNTVMHHFAIQEMPDTMGGCPLSPTVRNSPCGWPT